ncbi:MAG: YlxR family protein [Defluviitaleaceae bacterium]|nr:YlxR family protein [Defluviitaleaceae bacterium]
MKDKKELIRIVRFKNSFEIDLTQKKPGRGAYICKNDECLKKIFKKKSLEASFKSTIPHELYESYKSLMEEMNMS